MSKHPKSATIQTYKIGSNSLHFFLCGSARHADISMTVPSAVHHFLVSQGSHAIGREAYATPLIPKCLFAFNAFASATQESLVLYITFFSLSATQRVTACGAQKSVINETSFKTPRSRKLISFKIFCSVPPSRSNGPPPRESHISSWQYLLN